MTGVLPPDASWVAPSDVPTDTVFQSLPDAGPFQWGQRDGPAVYRSLASHWPAVRAWSMAHLASLAPPALPVQLVLGNRERQGTRFVESTLRDYLQALHASIDEPSETLPYLKEFDLLKAMPSIRRDLKHKELFPRHVLKSVQSWVGPTGGRTGLHRDYLDNLAVQIVGRKRFHLVRPGTLERWHAVSDKYDAWAVLARAGVHELAARWRNIWPDADHHFLTVDLNPGDVLQLPSGWWHEVINLSPSVSFGGFHGSVPKVLAIQTWVGARQLAHRWAGFRHGHCTCHADLTEVQASPRHNQLAQLDAE